jgi:hypothetical protein
MSSNDNPRLFVNQKNIKIKCFINDIDRTVDLISSRYFIMSGGGVQIYTGLFNNTNLLPVENVPFGLLKYHSIEYVFVLPSFIDTFQDDIKFIFTVQLYINRLENPELLWFTDETKTQETILKFMDGMNGIRIFPYYIVPQYSTIRLNETNNYVRYTDYKNYDSNKIFFWSIHNGLCALYDDFKNNNKKVDIVYDTQYYDFEVDTSIYRNDRILSLIRGDAQTNFILTYNLNENNKSSVVDFISDFNPIITIRNVMLKCTKSKYNLINNQLVYYFSIDTNKEHAWINLLNKPDILNTFHIVNLVKGKYHLTYDRVFLTAPARKKCAMSDKNCIEFNKSIFPLVGTVDILDYINCFDA